MPLLYLKALHLVSVVLWFAPLLVLPQVFALHAGDPSSSTVLGRIERLLHAAMNLGVVLTLVFGVWQIATTGWSVYQHQGWMHAKLTLVVVAIAYHGWCSLAVRRFRLHRNTHGPAYFRIVGVLPVVLLLLIAVLVIVKPF